MFTLLFGLLGFSIGIVSAAIYPSGCNYDSSSSMGLYTCDFASITLPLPYINFSNPEPQRLVIYDVTGDLSATQLVSGFSAFNYSAVNADYTNYLEIACKTGGSLQISSTMFTDMNYVNEFKMTGCNFTSGLPSSAFSTFVELDSLTIEGGIIASTQSDTFSGLNITKISGLPTPQGKLTIKNANVGSNFSVGFFDSLSDLSAVDISGCGLNAIDPNMFLYNNKIRRLNLANNNFTTISSSFLKNMTSLTEVNVDGISFDCSTCDNLWFLDHFSAFSMHIKGTFLCSGGERVYQYFGEKCRGKDNCNSIPGIAIGIDCFEWYQILNYCFTSASFALSWVAFVVVVIYRRDMYKNEKEIEIRKREKAIRVLEALKRGGGGGQKAPPKGNFSWAITEDGDGTEVKKAL
ncbi:uncharacterized protein LOC128189535 [Crassostrea angulata]|uniref:uncharacterized protein LOC128189535 n=1 Tax=Magallana angulata TaxID=2784310 RepID=UPI0022B12CDE|nr:uncharacterized protein LOC128189535 [Crassostrea angulata]